MRRQETSWLPLLSLVAAIATGCHVPQDQNVPSPARLIREPITGRDYRLYVSSRYDREHAAPVIISLHGTIPYDTSGGQMGEWKKIAEDNGAILVCPTLVSSDGIFPPGDDRLRRLMLEDERFVLTVLGRLHFRYNIDRRNIFLTSWSGGGYPLWFIGLRHPDLFAALCARQSTFRSSAIEGWYPPAAKAMPILLFHGTFDVIPIVTQTKRALAYLRDSGFTKVEFTTSKGGHVRHPEIAMQFFRRHWSDGPYIPSQRFSP